MTLTNGLPVIFIYLIHLRIVLHNGRPMSNGLTSDISAETSVKFWSVQRRGITRHMSKIS